MIITASKTEQEQRAQTRHAQEGKRVTLRTPRLEWVKHPHVELAGQSAHCRRYSSCYCWLVSLPNMERSREIQPLFSKHLALALLLSAF